VPKIVKIVLPVLVLAAIGVFGWLFLESTDNKDNAQRAAASVFNAADRAYDAATANSRFRAEEEPNYVSVGAIYTSSGNLKATLIVKGSNGVEAVCNRVAHVRDYLVVLLSDHPPDPRRLTDGPVGFPGSMVEEINGIVEQAAVERVRFDPFQIGATGGTASC
tara:strand:- start:295 stop:783 length:489 start_codon:yes stop_codon:yes gene_type:complete